ncbi:MAG TPA: prolyl oligopeptidase family serine peptidase [Candidatus Eisenbacteria bacterium]
MTALPPATHAAPPPNDPALWLEDVTGTQAMQWVGEQNARSTRELAQSAEFKSLDDRFLSILNSNDRIPYVTKIGDRYYNFWRDAQHERGLWRRTTLEEYRKPSPAWETVLDLDALGTAEKESWVWEGASTLQPADRLCLVSLSRGGADARVVREFDLVKKQFVTDGFTLPESKSDASWLDQDRLYVAVAFDSTTMTTSGYSRVIKEWRRGTPLSAATTVYEGPTTDVGVGAFRDHTPGFERDFVSRAITFYSNELYLRRDGKLVKIDKPDDADASVWREWLLVQLRTPWTVGGKTFAAGSLVAARFDDFVAGKRELEPLFTPTPRTSLSGFSTTHGTILLTVLDNVRSRVYVAKPGAKGWTSTAVTGLPEFGTISAGGVDDLTTDDYWLTITDFLTPTSLFLASAGKPAREKLKQTPAFFDGSRHAVLQHEAVSADGTHIPYFEVAPKGLALDGHAPTVLTGYGGFEVPELPYYSGVQGSGWIERGGVFVVANIRGGGEFGPEWHNGGVKENRHHCYEDFSAVARDLIARKVTSPAHLGCIGGSNGGLLVGNMLTQYPELFGAVVCQAPLLDMQRYSKLLAGASWMGEYGDPDQPDQWAYIQKFSPYHLLRDGVKYPRTLFTSSTRDDRVHPGHARRMVHKMEAMGSDVLYYENIEGGHGGAANNKQQAFMSALAFTFLWKQLGGTGW